MEDALYDSASMRQFAGFKLSGAIPDETTILNFRHLLEEYDLAEDILAEVNMHQTKKGNQWFFGMKAHIGVDAGSGLVRTVTTTAANEADVEQVADLLRGEEDQVWADSGYRGAHSRADRTVQWHIAARPSDIAKLPEGRAKERTRRQERRKASVHAKVEHPFRVIKRQLWLMKVRFRGLQKNTAHLLTLFALSNLWMARRQLMGQVRPKSA